MKKVLICLLAIGLVSLAGCESKDDSSAQIAFQSDVDIAGIRVNGASVIPMKAGEASDFFTIDSGTYPLEMMDAEGNWSTIEHADYEYYAGDKFVWDITENSDVESLHFTLMMKNGSSYETVVEVNAFK